VNIEKLQKLARLIRYYILTMTTKAGSGHPTSSLSSADLMAVLFANFFRYDFQNPDNPANDRLIFSKGHATPLYYALFAAADAIKAEELETYRQFGSRLEGHATRRFPYAEAATGSLGQGLSIGVGMALALKRLIPKSPRLPRSLRGMPKAFVLLGDGEMAEGNIWEAIEVAAKYKLNNLMAILDVNRLGQSQETMLGHDVITYQKRLEAFGWNTIVIDGHDYGEIVRAFRQTQSSELRAQSEGKPFAIIAKTVKGKGVSFLEDKEGWHGKPIPPELLDKALLELGKVDLRIRVKVEKPSILLPRSPRLPKLPRSLKYDYKIGDQVATRKAYGTALARLGEYYPEIIALDGDVKNSTYSEIFKEKFPKRFYEMYIAEQNMVGAAVGFSRMGFIPFVSTFAAFLTRAFDQIRMAAITGANIKFCGSHAGVSIGEDGPSQMGLEDLAMFRAVHDSVVLYPADAVSTEKLVEEMVKHNGISYLRTSRPTTPVIYDNGEEFPIGGCKIHKVERDVIPSDRRESRDLSVLGFLDFAL
jgi:transketolase